MVCVLLTTEQLAPVATYTPLVSSCLKSGVRIPLAPDFLILLFFNDLSLVLKHNQMSESYYHQARVGSVVLFWAGDFKGVGSNPPRAKTIFLTHNFFHFFTNFTQLIHSSN